MRLRRAGGTERERDGKRKRLSSPDGGWIQSALAWGGRGSVQPSCEFAFRLQRAPASASSECCTLSLQGFCFFLLLQRRLITAQSDARLIEPEGECALFCGPIKSRTCCSCQFKKRKKEKNCDAQWIWEKSSLGYKILVLQSRFCSEVSHSGHFQLKFCSLYIKDKETSMFFASVLECVSEVTAFGWMEFWLCCTLHKSWNVLVRPCAMLHVVADVEKLTKTYVSVSWLPPVAHYFLVQFSQHQHDTISLILSLEGHINL